MTYTIHELVSRVWRERSRRLRRTLSENGALYCVTCDACLPWRQMQMGHVVDGGRTVCHQLLFDERNYAPQCQICNIGKSGNKEKFEKWCDSKHGKGTVAALQLLRTAGRSYSRRELEQMYLEELRLAGQAANHG